MHWPFLQRNSEAKHCLAAGKGETRGQKEEDEGRRPTRRSASLPQLLSSAPFSQSALPSQRQELGTHW